MTQLYIFLFQIIFHYRLLQDIKYSCVCVHAKSHSQSCPTFATLWTVVAHQAPLLWDSPGKNTGEGCHALLQGIFPVLYSKSLLLIFFTYSSLYLLILYS